MLPALVRLANRGGIRVNVACSRYHRPLSRCLTAKVDRANWSPVVAFALVVVTVVVLSSCRCCFQTKEVNENERLRWLTSTRVGFSARSYSRASYVYARCHARILLRPAMYNGRLAENAFVRMRACVCFYVCVNVAVWKNAAKRKP